MPYAYSTATASGIDVTAPLHGSCISWQGHGVLILGAPGSGKSTLALECIHQGAELVADDAVMLRQEESSIVASCPLLLQGCLALRELGVLSIPFVKQAGIQLAVILDEGRLSREMLSLCEINVPCLHVPRTYPAIVALMRYAVFASADKHGIKWLSDEWLPTRLPI